MKNYSTEVPRTYSLSQEGIEDILADAEMIIGYWCSEMNTSSENETVTIYEEEAHDADEYNRKFVLSYQDILNATVKLADGRVPISSQIRIACNELLLDQDSDSYDAETADCIIQVACFGDVIYG